MKFLTLAVFVFVSAALANDAKAPATIVKLEVNTATEAQLAKLPGIGSKTARKIIAQRPYNSISDLSGAGLSAQQISRITPLISVTAKSGSTAANASNADRAKQDDDVNVPVSMSSETPKGMEVVWVNTETQIYYYKDDALFGKSKPGKYMTKLGAVQEGYHAAKK